MRYNTHPDDMVSCDWPEVEEMASPFPGMDPYLESPDIWPDLHEALAGEIRGVLNRTLPAPYYARLEMRPEVGIVEDTGAKTERRIVPDVSVLRPLNPAAAPGGTTVLDMPRTEESPSVEVTVPSEPLRHSFVEIRDPTRGHKLITLIEIVSPSNKRRGIDRAGYARKQREVLDSDANLVELDLLRAGERIVPNAYLADFIANLQPRPDYLVLVNRAWRRIGGGMGYQVFHLTVREPLPCIKVPLQEGMPEIPLDLQHIFTRAYDSGPYRRGAVDYTAQAAPPLEKEDYVWAGGFVQISPLR